MVSALPTQSSFEDLPLEAQHIEGNLNIFLILIIVYGSNINDLMGD